MLCFFSFKVGKTKLYLLLEGKALHVKLVILNIMTLTQQCLIIMACCRDSEVYNGCSSVFEMGFFFGNSLMSHFFVVSFMDNTLSITDCLAMFSSHEDEMLLECK